jgi:glutaredoxin/glutathione-dependent peroxiredoxin
MIEVGDKMPEATLRTIRGQQVETLSTGAYFAGRRVLLFGVPGAFTPTCSQQHLPGYVEKADELRASGIDVIACVSVNDPYVMAVWGEVSGAAGRVEMLSDGNGELARALGIEADFSSSGLGLRCRRFAAVVDDGRFTTVAVEPVRGITVCGAEHLLAALGEASAG